MSTPSQLIDAAVAVIQGVDGVDEVIDNGLDTPTTDLAVMVEMAGEQDDAIQELGGPLALSVTLFIGVAAKIGHNDSPAAKRDEAVAMARTIRRTLATNFTLGGACEDSKLMPTSLGYAKIDGKDYALADIRLLVQTEENI